ncbi:FAD dependent oxidoreductase-like protein [Coniochaeta ligniaria NRRL 30616]|uniref:FAD dependent oxidoreductase-like protein n=1 Tax=Coniochaeta ligniaria NRRL 30616 TaxID=1408157 RepID=A0A1J7IMC6_9PEZI|nr:FAD dependent oxidoreductase-like protein [Coniochaeta ligniaria NRRL 30616]
MSDLHVVVIGAGVIGLTAAVRLQEEGYNITVIAKDFPAPSETIDSLASINYTSPWGGAHNRWIPPPLGSAREHDMAVKTYSRMVALSKTNPEAGITFMKGIEYIEAPGPEYAELTEQRAKELKMPGFRLLRADEFPDENVKWGCEYYTWCVNPMVYCAFLLRRLVHRGGKIIKRELREPTEVYAMRELGSVRTVVNASGIGFGDRDVYPTRGQTCLVANVCDATVTRQNRDGSWTFCVPRNFDGGTIVGGTKDVGDWDSQPDANVRETLLDSFAATYPRILDSDEGSFKVIRDIVGRRPTRKGGMRLELEYDDQYYSVVHAYGLGGRGYELSWGVAEEVVELVDRKDRDR